MLASGRFDIALECGCKKSGNGRELGKWGYENHLETKEITRFSGNNPWGWY